MTEENRLSINSRISQFSFEHNDQLIAPFVSSSSALPIDRTPSPSKPNNKIDTLLKENWELKKKVEQQAQLISSLKNEIYELKHPATADVKDEQVLDQPVLTAKEVIITPQTQNSPIELTLPPRSSNRTKNKSSPASLDPSGKTTDGFLAPTTNGTEEDYSTLSTPIHATPKVDWDAALEGLNRTLTSESDSDAETNEYGKQDLVTEQVNELLEHEQLQQQPETLATPYIKQEAKDKRQYSGRILNGSSPSLASPSKVQSPIKATSSIASITTPRSETFQRSPVHLQHPSEEQRSLRSVNSDTYSTNGSRTNFTSPSHLSTQRIVAPPHLPSRLSAPSTPTEQSLNSNPNSAQDSQLLSKSNLYDPHSASSQQQSSTLDSLNQEYFGSPYQQSLYSTPSSQRQTPQNITFPSDVPLFVEPDQLSTIKPDVVTTIYGNPSKKSEDPIIIFSANDRATQKELWRFKKKLSQVVLLDAEIRPMINSFSLPPIPEKSLFLTNIPSKIDLRRMRIKDYFLTLFNIPNLPIEASYKVARFMSLDVVNLIDESNTEALKDGWLLRRGKGLGNNWKARYCEIDMNGPFLNVYDSIRGSLVEMIKLTGSQVGREIETSPSKDDKSTYRHAFAVLESKKGLKSNQFTKHIFCAETNELRDSWVDVLVQFTDDNVNSDAVTLSSQSFIGHEQSIKSPIPSPSRHTRDSSRGGDTDIDDDSTINESLKEAKKMKMRSFFAFGKKPTNQNYQNRDYADGESTHEESNIEKSLQNMNLLATASNKTIFQNELESSFQLSNHELFGRQIPSVMYRCIKFLIDHNAVYEEGIFRLSGSSVLIRNLKESFDKNYDVDLESLDPKPDINTIAGLLKLWLRELPSTILTKDLYTQYKGYYNNANGDAKQLAFVFQNLTQRLPIVNQSVLYVLFKFLSDVVQNKDSNKMNLRNLCIVFSPTLNIASEVLVPFLVDFKCIFENGQPADDSDREILDLTIPTF